MSQINFKSRIKRVPSPLDSTIMGVSVNIVSGWDAPLQYYHLTIFNLTKNVDEDVVWSNLDYFDFEELKTTEPLKKVLAAFGIVPPTNFWKIVELKEGNVIKELKNEKEFDIN